MTQEEFDSLAIFVAVAGELRKEPFISEDNHDRFVGEQTAILCHPAFLKSAVMPFRKIWMSQERCAFCKRDKKPGIRELVFRDFPNQSLVNGYHYWFYESFEKQLANPPDYGETQESSEKIINLWLNTQIAHAGPKNPAKKKHYEFDLADFDEHAKRIGREKFEFLFRTSLRNIGSIYIAFDEILASPLFKQLQNDQEMKPGFEAEMALKYTPYPDSSYNVIYDDVFWHLNRETAEETLERLLARQRFSDLQFFLHGLFHQKKQEAIACIQKLKTFDAILDASQAIVLEKDSQTESQLLRRSSKCDVFEGRVVRFHHDAKDVFSRDYVEFRARFFDLRKQQRQCNTEQEW